MKTSLVLALLISVLCSPGAVSAQSKKPETAAKAEDGSIEAAVVAINRGFGFLVVNAGSKQGVKATMKVAVLRGEKRFEGILRIGEIEEKETVLEFVPGKSDTKDKFTKVVFLPPKKIDEK